MTILDTTAELEKRDAELSKRIAVLEEMVHNRKSIKELKEELELLRKGE